MAQVKRSFGFNEIVKLLNLNKSTVFNILHTLNDLDVLEKGPDGRFRLGAKLFILGKAAAGGAELIKTIHPYLEDISYEFTFSTFLGILSGNEIMILDKADRAHIINLSSEIGMRIPIYAGAAGKALLCQLSEEEIDQILAITPLKKYTPLSIINTNQYKKEIMEVKEKGIAYDKGEYIEGIISIAVPIQTYRTDLKAAIWGVGFKQLFREDVMVRVIDCLVRAAQEINSRFSIIVNPSI